MDICSLAYIAAPTDDLFGFNLEYSSGGLLVDWHEYSAFEFARTSL